MKIVLNPIDDPSMSPITIEDDLFSIGRREQPFAAQPEDKSGRLSRRHARIFVENGACFIADLESLNGTFVNHERLAKTPVPLNTGDELDLGGEFRFVVAIEQDAQDDRTMVARAPEISMSLVPTSPHPALDTIVIGRYPFLISRKDEIFDRLKTEYPEDVQQISRRHAVIVLKGGQPCIEDLDSANGTFLDGDRLDERSRVLSSGSTVRFGDGLFSYTVEIEQAHDDRTMIAPPAREPEPEKRSAAEHTDSGTDSSSVEADRTQEPAVVEPAAGAESHPELEAEPESVPEPDAQTASDVSGVQTTTDGMAPDRTQFIDSATSFLDVFYDDDDGSTGEEEAEGSVESAKRRKKSTARLAAAASALGGRSAISPRVLLGALAAVALIGSIATYTYLQDADGRQVRALFEEEAYLESARKANEYLAAGSENEAIARTGEEALVRAMAPDWLSLLSSDQFDRAEDLLEQARTEFDSLPRAGEMLTVLGWAGQVAAHVEERPEYDSLNELFDHQSAVASLVTQWDQNSARFERLSRQMSEYDDDLADFMAGIVSDFRLLREQDSVYGNSIRDFTDSLTRLLNRGELSQAQTEIAQFKARYETIAGVDELASDVSDFQALITTYDERNLLALAEARDGLTMRTELVQEAASSWLEEVLPDAQAMDRFAEAQTAWRGGNGSRAVELLRGVEDPAWQQPAIQEAERMAQIDQAFEALEAGRSEAGFDVRLLEFWQTLTPEDVYYLEALRPDFEGFESEIMVTIDERFQEASLAWSGYQAEGGIRGVLRVEESVSSRFSAQAERLSDAYASATEAARLSDTIGSMPTPNQSSLLEEISKEAARQRRWLEDLRIVLDPDVLDAKLALLPEIEEES